MINVCLYCFTVLKHLFAGSSLQRQHLQYQAGDPSRSRSEMHKIAKRPQISFIDWVGPYLQLTLPWPFLLKNFDLLLGFWIWKKGSIFVFTSVAMLDKRLAYRVIEAYVQERTKASSANTIVWIHQENERNRLSPRQPQKKTSVQTLCLQKRVIFVLPPKAGLRLSSLLCVPLTDT